MKLKYLILTSLCSLGILAGCTTGGCPGCGTYYGASCSGCTGYYYGTYNSQCGLPSCTDNTVIVKYYATQCYGLYDCM